MRLDLIINTMFKARHEDRTITVNNPSIWRPILSIEDAATAYIRAIEADPQHFRRFQCRLRQLHRGRGWRLGEEQRSKSNSAIQVNLCIKHMQDFRNYKVSIEKARMF